MGIDIPFLICSFEAGLNQYDSMTYLTVKTHGIQGTVIHLGRNAVEPIVLVVRLELLECWRQLYLPYEFSNKLTY